MKNQINNMDLLKALFAIVVIVVCLIIVLLVGFSKESTNINKIMNERIGLAEWPDEVPLLKNKIYDIKKYGSGNKSVWEIECESNVSYAEFVNYLVEVESSDFNPIKETGSKSPRLLNPTPKMDEDFSITWYGYSDNYKIVVDWKNNLNESSESSASRSVFKVTLQYFNVGSMNIFDKDDAKVSEPDEITEDISGDIDFSGDIFNNSGDVLNASGELISGREEK